MFQASFDDQFKGYSKFFNSPHLSDGVVKSGDKEFQIHKIVLSARSTFFSNAFNGKWKESTDGVICLDDDDPHGVETMLRFMYTCDYDDGTYEDKPASSCAEYNVRVYVVADKYDVPLLKDMAAKKFRTAARECWKTDKFQPLIAQVYESTPPSGHDLRMTIVRIVAENMAVFLERYDFCEILEDTIGFAADLAKYQVSPDYLQEKCHCSTCKRVTGRHKANSDTWEKSVW